MPELFPSRTLALYLAKLFLVRSFAVLGALLLILQMLDLLTESDKILGVAGNGQAQLLTYVSLRLPQLAARFLPFAVLLGTLITLATLNQNSEVIAMKAAGLSAHQVLTPLFLASLLVAVAAFAFNERIVPRAAETLNRWQAVEYRPLPPRGDGASNVWVLDGESLIRAGQVRGRGKATTLTDISIAVRHGGSLVRTIDAERGRFGDQGLRLDRVRQFDVAQGILTQEATRVYGKSVAPDRFTLAKVDADGLSYPAMRRAVAELKESGRPAAALESTLWHKVSGPLSTVLMPLLGAVAAFGLARSGQLFVRAVIGMGLGFAYFVADNFGLAMGSLGAYPPLLAAWGPFLLFLLIGEAVLIRTEE